MEEIKFRAWDKIDQRMITHEQEFIPLKVTNIGVFRRASETCKHELECDKWELMPRDRFCITVCVRLKDMHDTEVYEGDIITSHIDDIDGKMSVGIVTIKDRKVDIECLSTTKSDFCTTSTTQERLAFLQNSCTVIGNIFENADLLPEYMQDKSLYDILQRDTTPASSLVGLDSHSTTPLDERAPAYT